MKITTLFILSLIIFKNAVVAQNLNELDAPGPLHQLIPGTNISMVPPTGFTASQNFSGFQHPDIRSSMIMVLSIPGPYSETSKGFTPEMLATKGMTLLQKKEVQIQSQTGLILEMEQRAGALTYTKVLLVYGDSSSTTMINGVCLKDSLALGKSIKESLYSTFIKSGLEVNPRANLSFTLNEDVAGFKFISVLGNGMLLSRDGAIPTKSPDKATLIVDKSFLKSEILDRKAFCTTRLESLPNDYRFVHKKGIRKIKLDGLNGYALYAKSMEKANEMLYQVILFEEDGGYFIFVGMYLDGHHKAIEDLKKIIRTFKRK